MPITPEQLAASNTEHAHQTALFCWAASSGIPELKWLFAIPNGGLRDSRTAGKLKAEGVKAGVWDIMLPVPSYANDGDMNYYRGLFIEMKVRPNKLTVDQIEFGSYVRVQGYRTVVCYSWQEARDCILEYLGKK